TQHQAPSTRPPVPLKADAWQHVARSDSIALAVTCRTARQPLNVVLGNEAFAELDLVRRRLVVHAEDGLARADVPLRVPVTVHTPFHLQRGFLPHERHAIDRAVA